MKPQDLLNLWGELTGENFRLVPYSVRAQAAEFCSAEFTEAELRLVLAYTQKLIVREECGYNPQSLTWRVMAADGWQKFQERLALARKTRMAARFLGAPKPKTTMQSSQASKTVDDETGREMARQLRAFREGGLR